MKKASRLRHRSMPSTGSGGPNTAPLGGFNSETKWVSGVNHLKILDNNGWTYYTSPKPPLRVKRTGEGVRFRSIDPLNHVESDVNGV